MKLYLVIADGTKFDRHAIWSGSQAEAASARKELTARGARRKDIKTTDVNVPTDKEGLLRFLNLMATSPTVAAAAEKLIG